MRSRTRVIAAAAVTAAFAAGSGAAVASTTGAKPAATAKTMSVSTKPGGSSAPGEQQVHAAITAAVARELHIAAARVGAALRPLFVAGRADPSSPAFAAAARSLGVSTQQLSIALIHAKLSLARSMDIKLRPGGSTSASSTSASSKSASSKSAGEQQGHDAITAAVAGELHIAAARVGAALRPLFAAGRAAPSSPAFAAAARSLGVSTQQLSTALRHAKESMAPGN